MTTHDRIAFAGAGAMAALHGLAVRAVSTHRGRPGAHVTAVASRTAESATSCAAALSATAVGYDDLPGTAGVVLVATPPDEHLIPALEAMAAGAAAIVETPLTARLSDADRLVRAVEGGADLAYAEHLLFAEAVTAARTSIAGLSDVTHWSAQCRRPRRGSDLGGNPIGGVLVDLAPHPLAVILQARSPRVPVAVAATLRRGDDGVDHAARLELRFDDDTVATVEVAWDSRAHWELQVASSGAVVRLELEPAVLLEIDGEPVPVEAEDHGELPSQLFTHGFVDLWAESLDAFDRHRSPAVSDVALGRDVLELIHAGYAAATTGGWVDVPLVGDRSLLPLARWH